MNLANALYDALAHGDDEHRAWLRGCIDGALSLYAASEGLDAFDKVDGGPPEGAGNTADLVEFEEVKTEPQIVEEEPQAMGEGW